MSDDPFDLIEQAARHGGAESALNQLVTIALENKNYAMVFEARLMVARHKLGLPLIFHGSLDDLAEGPRQAYQAAMQQAARETGSLYLADGEIPRAWPYFRAIGDPGPVSAAIDQVDAHEHLDGIIEIAFGQGVNPRKGFELLLKHYGICRAITFFQQYPDPSSREQSAILLLRALHRELLDNLKSAISRREGGEPASSSVSDLIRGRDWLFGDFDYYVDTSHLNAVIPLAIELNDPEAIELTLELCDYGRHLSANFQTYRMDPPFDDFFNDHAIYLRAMVGREADVAIAHFRGKLDAQEPTPGNTLPAQVLVALLARLERYHEAIDVYLAHLSSEDPNQLACPAIPRLCELAGDYNLLRDHARRRHDLLSFTAAAIGT